MDEQARLIQKGNTRAFEMAFKQLHPLLVAYARRFVWDTDLANQLVQDVFYKLWKNRAKIRVQSSLKAYLFGAVRNLCIEYIRHKQVENKYAEANPNSENNSWQLENDPVEYLELHNAISKTMENLPVRCREIFKLSRFEGLKYKEIADRLQVSIKTVESNMGKALKAFRTSLSPFTNTEQ